MSEPNQYAPRRELTNLPYHGALTALLKGTDPRLWDWFRQAGQEAKGADEAKFELLKSTYRIDKDSQPSLYETAEQVASQLEVAAPVTIYQAQNPQGLNASLAFVPGEIHLVFHGPVTTQLAPVEVRALVGHEVSHYILLRRDGGELLTANEMLVALTNDRQAHPAHFASWRLLQLYNEIFCDRGAFLVTEDLHAVVSMLVKVQTGVADVSPDAYLRQADEIFARADASTTGITHPETFIRARALRLWAEGDVDAAKAIARMIEGAPGLDELDLLAQGQVATATRRVLDLLLCRRWLQTDPILAHARLYFDGYSPPSALVNDPDVTQGVRIHPDSLRDYYCFVLLDFASADRELDEAPVAAAMHVAEQLGIKPRFNELARQELRMRKSQIEKIDAERPRILAEADRAFVSSP